MTKTEDLSAQVDGIKTTFVVSSGWVVDTLEVHYNGVRQRPNIDFTEGPGTTFTTVFLPTVGDTLLVQFETGGEGPGITTLCMSGVDPTL